MTGFAWLQQRKILVFGSVARHCVADSVAGRAGAMWTIERENSRRDLRVTDAAADAGEIFAVEECLPVLGQHTDQSAPELERGLHRVRQPPRQSVAWRHDQTIDDDLDGMLLLLVESEVFAQIDR